MTRRSDEILVPTEDLTLRRHTDISFPSRVRVGQWCNLRVQLVPAEERQPGGEVRKRPKPHSHDATLALLAPQPSHANELPPPVRVTVCVATENFEIRGPYRAEILVLREGTSPAVQFDLRGQETGPGRVMIDFTQNGRPVGSVDLRPEIVPEVILKESCVGTGVDPMLLDLGGNHEAAPDLVLKVFEHRLAGLPGRLQFVLSSNHPALADLPVLDGDIGTLDLRADVAGRVEAQLQGLRHLAGRSDATADEVTRVLADVGWKLYDQILPPALQDLCWTFRGRGVRSLLVLSDDPHIPWELVKPFRSDAVTGAIVAEEDHWGVVRPDPLAAGPSAGCPVVPAARDRRGHEWSGTGAGRGRSPSPRRVQLSQSGGRTRCARGQIGVGSARRGVAGDEPRYGRKPRSLGPRLDRSGAR